MRIGFIGLGNMGGPMASHIIAAGHDVTVYDVRREAAQPHLQHGAEWVDSPRAVAASSEITFTSLPGPKEVEAVALGEGGILQGAQPDSVYIDHAIYERVKPVLDAIGDKVSYLGGIGCGEIAKIVHNMIGICFQSLLAEGFTLGVKAGVEPQALLKAVADGAVGQGLMLNYMVPEVIFKGDYDTVRFALRGARKDLGLATELGRECEVPLKVASIVEQEFIEGLARGWAERDSTAPFALQEERSGVTVRAPKA